MLAEPVTTVFLLSPAYCGGRRASFLLREGSTLLLAAQLEAGSLTLGDAFSFMSGLYFRGKLGYARAFGRHQPPALVITPTRGLLPPETPVSAALLREFATIDVDADDERYRKPMVRSLEQLTQTLPSDARVVLLGSIATGKYVDVLTTALGDRLHFPIDFVGRGDMSRGGLMLRCVAAGVELPYATLGPHVCRHGARPPKLTPMQTAPRASRPEAPPVLSHERSRITRSKPKGAFGA